MSRTIDERVVEMRFDNKQFESATKETFGTLTKLKEALNFSKSADSFKDLQRSVNDVKMDHLLTGLEALQKRFSLMGIVGMKMVENVTDSILGTFGKAIKYIDDAIVSGGVKRAMNLEKAHFQLQSIIGDEVKVQAVMNEANKAVDGTAYSFDVAAKAASQFTSSGITDLETLGIALKGLTGTTATFSADYESMAMIWTQVAGQGRLMGDQLLQLSTRGANAAVTIKDFVNGVNSGAIQVSDSVKKSVQLVSTSTDNTEADIRDFVSKSKVNFEVFASAMSYAFGDSAQKANETFDGALSNIRSALARIGAGFVSPLIEQNSEIVRLFNSVRLKINDVKKALVFDESIGNVHALSKSVTDTLLSVAGRVADFVDTLDLSKPMSIFYYGLETVKNSMKNLYSVIKPVAVAFKEVFLTFNTDDILDIARNLEKLTRELKLSDTASKNLKDAFKGIFSVGKLLIDIFVGILKAIVPIGGPASSLGEIVLSLAGAIGRALTSFVEWTKESTLIKKSFEFITTAVQGLIGFIGKLAGGAANLVETFLDLPIVEETFERISSLIKSIGDNVGPVLSDIVDKLKEFKDSFKFGQKEGDVFGKVTDSVNRFGEAVKKINFKETGKDLSEFEETLQGLDKSSSDFGLFSFLEDLIFFIGKLKESLSDGSLEERIKNFKGLIGGFIDWLGTNVAPLFSNLSSGGVFSVAVGGGIIFTLIKMLQTSIKPLKKVTDTFETLVTSLKRTLFEVNNALKAYSNNLNASALIKVAGAIAILAASLVALSFVDSKKLLVAAAALSAVGSLLVFSINKLSDFGEKSRTTADALNTSARYLGKALNNYTKSIKWNAIAKAIRNFGNSVLKITASLIGLALVYKNDKESLIAAGEIMLLITGIMAAVVGTFAVLGKKLESNMKTFATASAAVLAISVSMSLCVGALKSLLKLEIPDDWALKLGIFAGLLASLGALTLVLQKTASINGGNKIQVAPILAVAVSMNLIVRAFKTLLETDLPGVAETAGKFIIFESLLVSLGSLILVMNATTKLTNGNKVQSAPILAVAASLYLIVNSFIKLLNLELPGLAETVAKFAMFEILLVSLGALIAVINKTSAESKNAIGQIGSILAICVFIGTAVAALMVLGITPFDKLIKGAVSLGILLVALGSALKGASGASEHAWRSVLAMAITVGTITASLGVLSMIPLSDLAKSAVSLGVVLIALSTDLKAASEISGKSSWVTVVAMCGAIATITASLSILAIQPWERIIAASTSLSLALVAMSKAFQNINETWGADLGKIALFLAATLAVVPIGAALYLLANQPWENILASGASLSGTIVAFGTIFVIFSKMKPDLAAIGTFLAATLALVPVAIGLYKLAEQPWENMLAAATGLSTVLLAMSAALLILSGIGATGPTALIGIALLDALIADLVGVFYVLGSLTEIPGFRDLIQGGFGLLGEMGSAIGAFFGNIVAGAITSVANTLPTIGEALSSFTTNAGPFFEMAPKMKDGLEGIKSLAEAVLIITGTQVVSGLTSWLTGGNALSKFGEELEAFGPHFANYYASIQNVDGSVVKSSADAAQVMADMANKLPPSDGLAQKLLGTRSLKEFGQELALFGPFLSQYAVSVTGVSGDVVRASADAAQVMADMANTLPESGGLAQKIFGERSLKEFGEELSKFGPYLRQYAISVTGLDAGVVTNSANAAQALSELANGLPNSGGLISLFTGDNDIAAFGQKLVSFGNAFKSYYDSVAQVNTSTLAFVVIEFQKLVNLASGVASIDTSGLSRFSVDLRNLGMNGIGEFISGFSESYEKVDNGIKRLMESLIQGIETRVSDVKTATEKVMSAITSVFNEKTIKETMMNVGSWIPKSLAEGISKNSDIAATAARNSASAIENAIRNTLDIHSISPTIRDKIGAFVNPSLAEGIKSNTSILEAAAKKSGDAVLTGLNDSIVYEVYNRDDSPMSKLFDNIAGQVDEGGNKIGASGEKVSGTVGTMFDNISSKIDTGGSKISESTGNVVKGQRSAQEEVAQIQNAALQANHAYWEELLNAKRQGAEAEKYIDMSIADFEKEVLSSTVEVLQEYADALESTTDSFMNQMNLFDEVAEKEAKSKEEITENLASQIREYENYTETLSSLNERLDGTALGEYLSTLGVTSLAQLQEINSMTDEELRYYSSLYDTRMGAATEAAATQLSGMREETEQKLGEIFGTMDTKINLYDFAATFDGSLQSIDGYISGLQTKVEGFGSKAIDLGGSIPTNITSGVEQGMEAFTTNLGTALETAITNAATSQQEIATSKGKDIGGFIDQGVGSGMTESTASQESATTLMNNLFTALANAGEIHSPSLRAANEIGLPIDQGIGQGLVDNVEVLTTAAGTAMDGLIGGFKTAFSERVGELSESIKTFADGIASNMKENLPESTFSGFGEGIVSQVKSGIEKNSPPLFTQVTTVCNDVVSKLKTGLSSANVKPHGENFITYLKNGMDDMKQKVYDKAEEVAKEIISTAKKFLDEEEIKGLGKNLCSWIADGIEETKGIAENMALIAAGAVWSAFTNVLNYTAYYNLGREAGAGLKKGIEDCIAELTAAAIAAAKAAIEKARRELASSGGGDDDDYSYSGDWYDPDWDSGGDGDLENDLASYSAAAATAAYMPMHDALSEIAEMVDSGEFDLTPTVTPVIDLSNAEEGFNEMAAMANEAVYDTSVSNNVHDTSASVASYDSGRSRTGTGENGTQSVQNNYEFVQNNYSPTALSRSDIYRQTKNQFSMFENAVNMA